MARRQQRHLQSAYARGLAELQDMLDPLPSEARAHQLCSRRREDCLRVIAGVVAVRVRDEGERLALPGIEPKLVAGQFKPAMEPDGNQARTLNRGETAVQRGSPLH